jgi:hypothetical protein
MPILYDMAGQGLIDAAIVKDIDEIMGAYPTGEAPQPAGCPILDAPRIDRPEARFGC